MRFTTKDAQIFANMMKINMNAELFTIDDLTKGMNVELEHGKVNRSTNITNDDIVLTGKIALAHLNEFPDYYTRLERLEAEADAYWKGRPKKRQHAFVKKYKLHNDTTH